MPANLSHEYRRVETLYREAKEPSERLACLVEMLRVIPKHKGTDHMQADIKKRISQIKLQMEKAGSGGKKQTSHMVRHEGAGQIVLVGTPNTGKSHLVKSLTHASPVVGEHPFSTHAPVPGMMAYADIHIQLVDLPPISRQHTEKWIADCVRVADAAFIVLDLNSSTPDESYKEVMEIMLKGFVSLAAVDDAPPADFRVKQIPSLVVVNKCDAEEDDELLELVIELVPTKMQFIPVSAKTGRGLEGLREAAFKMLNIMRVYSKAPGKPADMKEPFAVPCESTVLEFATTVHQDFARDFKSARIWGVAKFDGQSVSGDHVLHDGDIVELRT
ncbi:GTPase [Candidatus Hydrogenedentota bacterium]